MFKVSFLGLGVMGYPMAGHIAAKGHQVTVYNRTHQKALTWAQQHVGRASETIQGAVSDADFVLMCVGDDNDVLSVGTRAIEAMKSGAVLIDHTTASADVARTVHSLATERQIGFLDAPVSGGQAGAENGLLTVMVGGAQATYDAAKPIIDCFARHSQLLGDVGSGQLAKMMNQICIAGVVQGLAEAIHFGKRANMDCEKVIEVISKGAAQSWQMENRAQTMIDNKYDFGFAVDWMRKDLAIALSEARRNGSTLSLTALVDQYYADVQKGGGGRWDTSSLLTRLES